MVPPQWTGLPVQETSRPSQGQKDELDDDANNAQAGADDATDPAPVRVGTPRRIHHASIHLLEVARSHDPGRNPGEQAATWDAQNAQNQNKCASMRFHRLRIGYPANAARIRFDRKTASPKTPQ